MELMFESKYFEIVASVVVFILLMIVRAIFRSIIRKHAHKYDLDIGQRKYANKFFNFVLAIFLRTGPK
jgi:hypothetical protein